MNICLKTTADGSDTLYVPELDEHYHSTNGAIQESSHVFINAGLKTYDAVDSIHILEIGFGTGLNAFLTLLYNRDHENKHISYTGIEAYPISKQFVEELNYSQVLGNSDLFSQIHETEWGTSVEIEDHFRLKKIQKDARTIDFDALGTVNVIYFDAFGPDKQSDLWTQDIFDNLYKIAADKGILVTYCAKGVVRRMLQQSGFIVERLPGPPGKREMLRATKYL